MKIEVEKIRKWSGEPELLKAVQAQNQQELSLEEIQRRDKEWVAAQGLNDLMKEILNNPCSLRLKKLIGNNSSYAEMFAMDSKGALVCSTVKTSDYWQGDEEKWSQAFLDGKGATFVGKRQYDESSRATLQHVSVPILHNEKAIGVLVVGINLTRLAEMNR